MSFWSHLPAAFCRGHEGNHLSSADFCTPLTINSYGLFKAADKKMFKNEDIAAELGRPEKLVEM